MSHPSADAGSYPQLNPAPHEVKLTSAEAKDLEYRSIPAVVVLTVLTLFIGYPIYLCYQWARELNGLLQQRRHSPVLAVVLSIVTLGVGLVIYECIYASDLERYFREKGRTDGMPYLTAWVIALNIVACILVFTAFLFPLAIPCCVAATCLVQAEFNKLAVGTAALKGR